MDTVVWKVEDQVRQLHLPRSCGLEARGQTPAPQQESGHWYGIFTCEVEAERLPLSYEDVGIDLGVTHFAALSTGEFSDHPRYFRRAEKKLVKAHQALSRKKRGSHRRAKAVKQLARAYRKVRNQRRDFQHKASRTLVNRFQVIVLEDLQVKNLTKAPAPKQDEQGNPSMRSQMCPKCETMRKKTLDERWHSCECGCELDRDTAAASVILSMGHKHLSGGTLPTRATA